MTPRLVVRVGLVGLGGLLVGCEAVDVGARSNALGSTSVVLSQLYTAGGNSGAKLKSSYVELFNRGTTFASLSGWSLQYASASSATWNMRYAFAGGDLPPGGYYIVELNSGANGAALPVTPDEIASTFSAAAAGGKVALVNSTTALTCGATQGSCMGNPSIVDLVGWGSAADSETAPAANPQSGNNSFYLRNGGSCADTDDNATDFTLGAIPTDVSTLSVHTSASTPAACNASLSDMSATATDLGSFDLMLDGPIEVTQDLAKPLPGNIVKGTTATNGNAGCSTSGAPDRVGFVLVMLAVAIVRRRYGRAQTALFIERP